MSLGAFQWLVFHLDLVDRVPILAFGGLIEACRRIGGLLRCHH